MSPNQSHDPVRDHRIHASLEPLVPFFVFGLCIARYLWLVNRYAVNVFVGDQWFYERPVLNGASLWTIFRWEANPWREGLGGLMSAWIGPLFKWNSRADSFVAATLMIIGCALALWLNARIAGKLTIWASIIPLFVLSPLTHQSVIGVSHFSHGPLPFALLMLLALSWTIEEVRLRYMVIGVLTALSISTGFGFVAGIIVPPILLIELVASHNSRIWKIAALGMIAAAWILFFVGYSTANSGCPVDGSSSLNPLYYCLFVVFMFANAIGIRGNLHMIPAMLSGVALLLWLGIVLWRSKNTFRDTPTPFLLIGFSLLFAASAAVGRICLGLGVALGSRYVIYLVPAFIGMYLLSFNNSPKMRRYDLICIAGLALLSSGYTHPSDKQEMASLSSLRLQWRECYLQTRNLHECNVRTGATVLTYPEDIQGELDILERNRLNLFSDRISSETRP